MVELADVVGAETAFTRHEHVELRAGLDMIHRAARALIELTAEDAKSRLRAVCSYVSDELMPHVAWEGAVIFPEVDQLSATTWPTRLMRFDHVQINRAALAVENDVERICQGGSTALGRLDAYDDLVTLEALIRAHLEREDAFVMPILDARGG
jgi:hemerythrin-like domain-containing protein